MSTDSERRELMLLAKGGDADAFNTLFDDLAPRALGIASGIVHSQDRTADVVHEAFLAMWHSRDEYRPEACEVHTWAFGIVRACALAAGGDGSPAGRSPLSALPLVQREVIALAFHGGLSHTEIAEQLSLPADIVKGRMRLGLNRLRATMDAGVSR